MPAAVTPGRRPACRPDCLPRRLYRPHCPQGKEHNMVNPAVLDWLLEEENPSVRCGTLLTLMGKSPDDPEVISARTAIMEKGAVPKILSGQNSTRTNTGAPSGPF